MFTRALGKVNDSFMGASGSEFRKHFTGSDRNEHVLKFQILARLALVARSRDVQMSFRSDVSLRQIHGRRLGGARWGICPPGTTRSFKSAFPKEKLDRWIIVCCNMMRGCIK